MQLGISASLAATAAGALESATLVTNTKSIAFDGVDEFITLPQGVITSTGNFTFACWFKYDSTSNHKCLANFHSSSSNDGMQIIMQGTYDEIDVSIRSSADAAHSYRSSTEFTTDTWYHIVATKTANTLGTIYINGEPDSGTTGGTWSAKGEDAIGSRKSSAIDSEWNGHLDEIGIWNSVLTATEAKAIYDNVRLDFTKNSAGYASSSNLKGWWRMGDEADTRVLDTNANNLIVPDMRKTFFTGKSIDFDNSDDYIAANGVASTITDFPFTMSAWANLESSGSGETIVSFSDVSDTDVIFQFSITSGADKIQLLARENGGSSKSITASSATTPGVWVHIVGVFASATSRKLYINGAQEGSEDTNSVAFDSDDIDTFTIGGLLRSNVTRHFGGKIADVAIWNAELNDDTITSIYNSGEPNDLQLSASYTAGSGVDKTSNLQGYWRMGSTSDDSHPTIQDQTSNNNDGTKTSMSAYDIVEHAPNRHSGDMIGFDATSDIENDVKT